MFYWDLLRFMVWIWNRRNDEVPEDECGRFLIRCCCCRHHNPTENQGEIMARYKLDATHPPVPFSLDIKDIRDANGNTVDRDQVVASSEGAGEVIATYDNSTNVGQVSFSGVPGGGSVTHKVVDKDDPDQVLAQSTDAFDLFAGDPESVGEVTAVFEGLTAEPETPTPTPEPVP